MYQIHAMFYVVKYTRLLLFAQTVGLICALFHNNETIFPHVIKRNYFLRLRAAFDELLLLSFIVFVCIENDVQLFKC